jgi:ABC-type branched-subunit amino acid transport system ATPase component
MASSVTELTVQDLDVFYGQAQAVRGVSLSVQAPGITCLIGRNGVGKTTTLRAIMGLHTGARGHVRLGAREVGRLAPHARAALGVRLIPQEQVVFPGLTVGEHLRLARVNRARAAGEQWADYFPIVRERRDQRADTLSGGERKLLAITQALIGGAEFLLMDEPTEGVQPNLVETIAEAVKEISRHVGVLLVEQNLAVVMHLGGPAYIMEKGAVAAAGPVAELHRQGLIQRYLTV